MHIGAAREYKQIASLHEYHMNVGQGLMGLYDQGDLPQELIDFCFSQYDRFGIPRPPLEVVLIGAWSTYEAIDIAAPYSLFMGVSDVDMSPDWQTHTFDIVDPESGRIIEAEPEWTETFCYIPGQAEESFNRYMSHPGLERLPYPASEVIELCLDGEWNGEEAVHRLSEEDEMILRSLCAREDGSVDGIRVRSYFKLAAWAAWCWFVGPLSREWRYDHHDIFNICLREGECLLYEGVLVEPKYYKKINRPPQSCAACGLSSWCVEMSQIQGTTRYICEHCLNGPPIFEQATCGTRACRHVECPYNKFHGVKGGIHQILHRTGQLSAMVRERQPLLAGGEQIKQLEAR